MPKTRKYPCCIRILHERADNRPKVQLVLLIKGRQVEATQKKRCAADLSPRKPGARRFL